jgi:hypothetical protein
MDIDMLTSTTRNNNCKWLDLHIFSDKEVKSKVLSPYPYLIYTWGTLKNLFNSLYKSRGLSPGSTAFLTRRFINILIPHDCKLQAANAPLYAARKVLH